MMMRLDRVLSTYTTQTRREIKKIIQRGGVRVDGAPVTRPEASVDTETSLIERDGEALSCRPMYVMMNKPAGVVSATRDARARTALELVPAGLRRKGLFPAGRLDRDTEGFLLLTDDGDFAHRILSPKRHVPKEYRARYSGELCGGAAQLFAGGLELSDGTLCRPALLEILGDGEARVVLHEGMYHQVKRMIARCGGEVTALRRTRIGGLPLDGALAPGGCREITVTERDLLEFGGGKAQENGRA